MLPAVFRDRQRRTISLRIHSGRVDAPTGRPGRRHCERSSANLSREAEEYIRWVRASPPMEGVARVRMPGEPEEEYRAERGRNGIPIDPVTWGEIVDAGEKVGLKQAALEALAKRA